MKTINNDQIERFLEDISSIKEVINRNKPVLQKVLNPARFRFFMLLVSLSIIGFSLLIFFLMQHYGSFGSVPSTLKYIIYAAVVADLVIMQILKIKYYSASVKNIDQSFTLRWWLKELFSHRIAHLYVPITILVVFLSVYFILNHIPYFIIPAISILYGLLSNFIGGIIEIKHSLIFGYWFLITGIGTLIFSSIPATIALSITIGCGFLIISISGYLTSGPKEGDQSCA